MAAHPLKDDLSTDLKEALREIARSSDIFARSLALYDLTKALSNAGLVQETNTVVAEARNLISDIERERHEEVRTRSYANVTKAIAITDTAEEVTRLVADFQRVTRVDWTDMDYWGALLVFSESILEDTDDVQKALALIRGIPGNEQREYANGSVCKTYARLGQANDVLELASQIEDQAPHNIRSFILAECAEILGAAGAAEDALQVARQTPTDRNRSNALYAVAQSFSKLGRVAEARTALEQARVIHRDGRGGKEFALMRASTILAKMGDFDEALAVANEIEPERPRHSHAVADVCRSMACRGNLSEAQRLASKVDNKDAVALGIVKGLTDGGRLGEAEKILMRIKDEDQRREGWETIGRRLSSESNTSEVMRIAERLPRYNGDDILRSLIESLAKVGNYQEAVEIVAQRWRSDPVSRVDALATIFRGARIGTPQLDDADQLQVEDSASPADFIGSDNVADVGQQATRSATRKGFSRKLFG